MKNKAIAVFGTASDVGKSVIATALCRIFANDGIKVAPFKAQNMSNNAFVTLDAKEIGVAQAAQAFACKIQPTADMNPVLLKPSSETGFQIILKGKPIGSMKAKDYFKNTDELFKVASKSLKKLQNEYELIIIEGAGSCAEVNLKSKDFANFKSAYLANANVILVADIDKGGVFAQIIGTLECLDKNDRQLIKGIIINKFRGNKELFQDGIKYIEEKTKLPVLGLVPYYKNIEIDCEDSLSIDSLCNTTNHQHNKINIAVLRLPYISNFTDFLPFKLEESVALHYLSKPQNLDSYDALIIPGSKSVAYDLEWLKKIGWDVAIRNYSKQGGYVVGICGGYQMLGGAIYDHYSIESEKDKIDGLGILDIETTLEKDKALSNSEGFWMDGSVPIKGYEIHMGKTKVHSDYAIKITKRNGKSTDCVEGAVEGNIYGFYFHGIFDEYRFRHYFLDKIAKSRFKNPNKTDYTELKDMQYELLAEHFEKHMDLDKLIFILGLNV